MFRDRKWRDLLLLIDWLPRNSAFMEAMSDDEEIAGQYLDQNKERDKKGSARPRMSEWSAEVERLTDLVDRMGEVVQAVIAVNGGKAPKLRPQPRPKTALDRVREKRRYEHHKKVVSRVLIQNPDGTARPVNIPKPPKKTVPVQVAAGQAARPAILPGEDPFRLKAPRRRPPAEGGAVTGEPKPAQ